MKRTLLIHPKELDMTWVEQAKALRLDGLGLHPVGGRHADRTLADMLASFGDSSFRACLDKARQAGIEITCEMHALRYLLPLDMLERNPRWRRMNEAGERVGDMNFCVSCPEALEALSESAARLYAMLPGRPRRAALWLDDGQDAFCHCPKCRDISPSDQQMIALNAILRGIRSVRGDACLAYLAYFETLPSPTRDDLKEGLYLQFAPYRRNLTRPLSDAACPENAREAAHLSELIRFFGKADATALDYWYDNSLLSHYTKPPQKLEADAEVVKSDIKLYEGLGFEYVSSFACYLGADYRALYGMPDLNAFAG